ncbi:M23 family metallopeptidase [Allobacillus sp. SKP2-8]|uniref:M23 family metallopeptidase n=1 Tax=unclassified Allobacillus TaxID=2628859 RepID=UPI0011829B53|nr:M23 family metallopeptidase [Allobacillus sp. SKP2-8]TSJ60356.1 M23 family metallopeptidase [Allobacillus sp. SKP2-8]
MRKFLCLLIILLAIPVTVQAEDNDDEYLERMGLYRKTAAVTDLPWYSLAAMDQYERNINKEIDGRMTGIIIKPETWFGLLNFDNKRKHSEEAIQLFGGKGMDGNGDGIADIEDDEDVLYTYATIIQQLTDEEGTMQKALETYYDREKAADLIALMEKIFHKFQTLDLSERSFIVSKNFNYSYKNTWGDSRGYGGRRIHEGTDIFAGYGTPVKSASYGIVEIKGWNKFGGWRVGIRDAYNIYHYYAHLSRFEEKIEEGTLVKPGQVIGYVGSTGYGPEGTQGKFPPHLHYGIYKDNGKYEWAYDPYPSLKRWERNTDG